MRKKWTEEEVQFLKFAYPNKDFTIEEIIKAFPNRTYNQISSKASSLGLKRYKEKLPKGFKKCARCSMILPLDEFYNSKNSKDGKNSFCKSCDKKRKRKNDIVSNEDIVSNKTKKCTNCNKEKSLNEFSKKKDTKDGYQYSCKECAAKYKRRRAITGGY